MDKKWKEIGVARFRKVVYEIFFKDITLEKSLKEMKKPAT